RASDPACSCQGCPDDALSVACKVCWRWRSPNIVGNHSVPPGRLGDTGMEPQIVRTAAHRFVCGRSDEAVCLRQFLLRYGIPCAATERYPNRLQVSRRGERANVGAVQALLARWK